MKKLYITASLTFMALLLMSFTTMETETNFNELIDVNLAIEAEVSSFEKFEERRLTSDKNEWYKRHKTWTEFAFNEHLSSIVTILERN